MGRHVMKLPSGKSRCDVQQFLGHQGDIGNSLCSTDWYTDRDRSVAEYKQRVVGRSDTRRSGANEDLCAFRCGLQYEFSLGNPGKGSRGSRDLFWIYGSSIVDSGAARSTPTSSASCSYPLLAHAAFGPRYPMGP